MFSGTVFLYQQCGATTEKSLHLARESLASDGSSILNKSLYDYHMGQVGLYKDKVVLGYPGFMLHGG